MEKENKKKDKMKIRQTRASSHVKSVEIFSYPAKKKKKKRVNLS